MDPHFITAWAIRAASYSLQQGSEQARDIIAEAATRMICSKDDFIKVWRWMEISKEDIDKLYDAALTSSDLNKNEDGSSFTAFWQILENY